MFVFCAHHQKIIFKFIFDHFPLDFHYLSLTIKNFFYRKISHNVASRKSAFFLLMNFLSKDILKVRHKNNFQQLVPAKFFHFPPWWATPCIYHPYVEESCQHQVKKIVTSMLSATHLSLPRMLHCVLINWVVAFRECLPIFFFSLSLSLFSLFCNSMLPYEMKLMCCDSFV